MEIVIDFGYIVLFSAAFPIAPFLALIMSNIEIRVDSIKICYLTKRPYPQVAKDIGMWTKILRVIAYFGVFTNTAIVIFAANIFADFSQL